MRLPAHRLPFKAMAALHTVTVNEYDRMNGMGLPSEGDPVELLEGSVVLKPQPTPADDDRVTVLTNRLFRLSPVGWAVRSRVGATPFAGRPEPDVAVARGARRDHFTRHPGPSDLGLVVEASDASLDRDQQDKARIYARDRVPVYRVVDLVDRRVEVYTDPTGPGDAPRYHTLRVFSAGAAVPVELDGAAVGAVPVDDLLP